MIRFKTGICSKCPASKGEQKLYARGLCNTHYWNEINLSAAKKSSAKKICKKCLVNQNVNLVHKPGAIIIQPPITGWFDYHINISAPFCENCNSSLNYFNKDAAYSCQAHILPKSTFPSVKTVLANHLTLGGLYQNCECHGQYDSNWKNAEQMPVFKIALERFKLFKHLVDPAEHRRLPEPFLKLL